MEKLLRNRVEQETIVFWLTSLYCSLYLSNDLCLYLLFYSIYKRKEEAFSEIYICMICFAIARFYKCLKKLQLILFNSKYILRLQRCTNAKAEANVIIS